MAPRTPGLGPIAAYLMGMGGLAFTLTILWLSMRAVMGSGGSCASGGPYVPAVECPDAVVAGPAWERWLAIALVAAIIVGVVPALWLYAAVSAP